MTSSSKKSRIPVTILTGFLGSGKTTLLNHLIKENSGLKIAIIENEFGEISIDSELVVKQNEGIFELSNGCICCTLSGELKETLDKITQNRNIDHLIIETTGIADPGPIALSFISDYQIQAQFELDSIICLVDARFIETQLAQQPEASKQIALADIVLLNKTDLVDQYQIEVVQNIISDMTNQASIYSTTFGKTDRVNLLEINAFSANKIAQTKFVIDTKSPKLPKFTIDQNKEARADSLLKNQFTNVHKTGISSVSVIIDQPFDVLKFDTWLNVMLNWGTGLFYRGKGILYIEDFDKKIIFQSVMNQFMTESGGEWEENKKQTKIVFIGKHLDKELIENSLKSCVVNDIDASSPLFFDAIMDVQNKIYDKMKESSLSAKV